MRLLLLQIPIYLEWTSCSKLECVSAVAVNIQAAQGHKDYL